MDFMKKFRFAVVLLGLCLGLYTLMVRLPRQLYSNSVREQVLIAHNQQRLYFDDKGLLKTPLTCEVVNQTSHPVTIIGVRSSCSCAVIDDQLPRIIAPHGTVSLPVSVAPPEPGDFASSVDVYTDDPVAKVLTFSFTGRVDRKPGVGGGPH